MGNQGEIVLYQPDEAVKIEVRLEDDNVWLTQAQMVELFRKDQSVIARHIRNIFNDGELDEKSNMRFLHNTLSKYKPTGIYSLDVVISVGYRVKSYRGVQFRIWSTNVLKDYLLKGYSINQRLNQLEDNITAKFIDQQKQIGELKNKVDFFVHLSLPPIEGIFFDGQIFDAYTFAANLIKCLSAFSLIVHSMLEIRFSLN